MARDPGRKRAGGHHRPRPRGSAAGPRPPWVGWAGPIASVLFNSSAIPTRTRVARLAAPLPPLLRDPGTVPLRRADSPPLPRPDCGMRRSRLAFRPAAMHWRAGFAFAAALVLLLAFSVSAADQVSISNHIPALRPFPRPSRKPRVRRSHAPGPCISAVRLLMALPGMALASAPTASTAAPR
jgi:hypothetical protein